MRPFGQARTKPALNCGKTKSLTAGPLFSATAYKQLSCCLAHTIYFQENKLQIIFMRENTLQTNSEFKFLIAMPRIL